MSMSEKKALWIAVDLHIRMKFAALREGITVTEAAERAVQAWLEGQEEEDHDRISTRD